MRTAVEKDTRNAVDEVYKKTKIVTVVITGNACLTIYNTMDCQVSMTLTLMSSPTMGANLH